MKIQEKLYNKIAWLDYLNSQKEKAIQCHNEKSKTCKDCANCELRDFVNRAFDILSKQTIYQQV